jgi:putative endopeptidase
MLKIFKWRTNKFVSLNNKPIVEYSIVDWKTFQLNGTQTYVVNAFYVPTFNRIFLPLAYLQRPFIDLEDRGIEYNLANLGYVIAHEFSHSLDVIGSKYDYNGNLKNWWTNEDKKKYQKLVNDVNAQYKKFMSYDKLYPNVELYIGENIADITGIALCNDYLMLYHSVKENLESVSTTFLSLKTFYNYYAI